MKAHECRTQRLAEYIDGELSGIERLHVSRHLEQCAACGEEAESLRRVGDLLRDATALRLAPADIDGLAGGVVSRVTAERALSWRGVFGRAVEDWHWFLVGFGSVTAAFVSITFVSALLHFGPAPEREDSVSALLSSSDWSVRNSQDGSIYVWARPIRETEWRRIMLTSRERAEVAAAASEEPASIAGLTTQGDVTGALGDTFTRGGPIDLRAMTPAMRSLTGALIGKLKQLQKDADAQTVSESSDARGPVYRLQFVTNTEVTAKGF